MERTSETRSDTVELENRIDEAVMSFIIDMKYKLRMNNHKGHWMTYSWTNLLHRLKDEVAELHQVMPISGEWSPNKRELMAVVHECADVANFAMMIADNAKRRLRE